VPYREFYDGLIEAYFGETEPYSRLVAHLNVFLADERALEDLPFEHFAERPLYLEPSRWVFVQICLQLDRYFDGIQGFLLPRFPRAINLQSALDYQRHVMVRPGDHGTSGRCFRTDHDWATYFERARRLTTFEHLGEPSPSPGAIVTLPPLGGARRDAARDESGLWLDWLEGTHEVRRTLSTCFQHPRLDGTHDARAPI
jgi:putative methyltransferase